MHVLHPVYKERVGALPSLALGYCSNFQDQTRPQTDRQHYQPQVFQHTTMAAEG